MNLKRKFFAYLKGTLIYDILSTIPFLFSYLLNPYIDDIDDFIFVSILTLLKLIRLESYGQSIKRLLEYFNAGDNTIDILTHIVITIIVFHQFIGLQLLPGIIATRFFNYDQEEFWFDNEAFRNSSHQNQFILSTYRAISTLYGSGFQNFQPTNVHDKNFLSFICITGCIIRAILKAMILEKWQGMRSHRIKYEEFMNQLQKFIKHKELPTTLTNKLKKYYAYLHRGSYFREDKIISCVPTQLNQDILLHNTRVLIERVPFFANIPSPLFHRIVSRLHREIVLEGDVITKCGEVGHCMYFVVSGALAMYSPSGMEITHLVDGQFFGELALVMDHEKRILRVVSLEICELYR